MRVSRKYAISNAPCNYEILRIFFRENLDLERGTKNGKYSGTMYTYTGRFI